MTPDPTTPIALALVPAASEAAARLTKRLPWVKGRPQRWRRAIVRGAAVAAGLAVRFGLVATYGWLGWGPGFDQATGQTLALVAAEGLLEALAPLGLYRLTKKAPAA